MQALEKEGDPEWNDLKKKKNKTSTKLHEGIFIENPLILESK